MAVRQCDRAERGALDVGPAVEDAVHEDRAAEDRRRERVPGEERDERRGREDTVAEETRVDERLRDAQPAHDREDARDDGDHEQDAAHRERRRPFGTLLAADQGHSRRGRSPPRR